MNSPPTSLGAVVFDWAGTILDFGSCAPMGAFVRLFEKFGPSKRELDLLMRARRDPEQFLNF